jgi:3-hydroxyisobutyrate dehydrogenase
MTLRAGFIGLGNIGKPLASHLAPAGFETPVFDIADEPVRELVGGGAKAAASPREVAAASDVLGICVPEDKHVFQVMTGEDGVLAGASAGSVVAIISTIQPATAIELAALAAQKDVSVLDACVTGGAHGAEAGEVTYLLGGDDGALEKARPFLEANSKEIIHAGELGNGAKLKLAINVLSYIQWAAAYEAFKLATASGLPAEVFEEAGISNGQLTEMQRRYLIMHKMPEEARQSEAVQTLNRGFMNIAEKDLAWALQLGRESGVALPVAGQVSQIMARIYGVEDDGRR